MKKIVLFPLFLVFLHAGYSQDIDRFIFSSAYVNKDTIGEWVLGESLVGDFTAVSGALHNGFLQMDLVITSAMSRYHPYFSFNAFPNPTDAIIHLVHSSPQPIEVQIFDLMGRLVAQKKNVGAAATINIYSLPLGAYTLRYSSGSGGWGAKLILKTK